MPKSHSNRVALRWTTTLLIGAAFWAVFAYSLTPAVIAKAYRGESLAILNHFITGQANRPVTDYLTRWNRLANTVSFSLVVLVAYILCAAAGLARSDALAESVPMNEVAMSKPRLLVIYALGAVIFGGAISDLARDKEHWPFAPYAMFSEISASKTYSMLRLYGVVQRSPLVEIQLDDNGYLRPFDNSRLADALEHARRENKLDDGVTDCLKRYEALRRAGRHNGPPVVAMRLYRVTWSFDPSASNVERPDRRELLAEVSMRRDGGD
jgi:hypothetical protein